MPSSRLPNDVEGVLSKPDLHDQSEAMNAIFARFVFWGEKIAKLKIISARNAFQGMDGKREKEKIEIEIE